MKEPQGGERRAARQGRPPPGTLDARPGEAVSGTPPALGGSSRCGSGPQWARRWRFWATRGSPPRGGPGGSPGASARHLGPPAGVGVPPPAQSRLRRGEAQVHRLLNPLSLQQAMDVIQDRSHFVFGKLLVGHLRLSFCSRLRVLVTA
jgi:hypothetical protein